MSANHLTDIDSFEDIIKLCLDGKEVSIYERPHTFLYTGRIVLYINFPIEEVHPALRDRFSIVQPQDVKTFLAIEGILTQD